MAQEHEEPFVASRTTCTADKSIDVSREENTSEGNGKGSVTRRQVAKTATGQDSEGGHDLYKIRPMAKHSGDSVVTFFNGLFQTIIAISTLGTSITFSFILSNNIELASPTAYYSQKQVTTFLAISWLLFLLALAFGSFGSTLLTFFRVHWIHDWDGDHGRHSQFQVQMYAVLTSGLLGGIIVGAFVFLCLVVVAYSPVVGWIALAFVGIFGLIIFGCVIYQTPWPWRNNTPDLRRRTLQNLQV